MVFYKLLFLFDTMENMRLVLENTLLIFFPLQLPGLTLVGWEWGTPTLLFFLSLLSPRFSCSFIVLKLALLLLLLSHFSHV